MMDIWKKLYDDAKKQYHPESVSPFIQAHHVACAIESETGEIYTGFCIESACGVMHLCAERMAALNMYMNSNQTVIKRLLVSKDKFMGEDYTPCGACREFILQLSEKNKDMEIMIDFEERKTVTLEELMPHWWGWARYKQSK